MAEPVRPRVVLGDGRAPEPPVTWVPPRRPRRLVPVSVVVLVVAGLAALLPAQAREREQRRLDAVLALAVDPEPDVSVSADPATTSATVLLKVRNDGPRPVVVSSAGLVGTALTSRPELVVDSGAVATLRLTRAFTCRGTRPDLELPGRPGVELVVQTRAGERTVEARLLDGSLEDGTRILAGLCAPVGDEVSARVGSPFVEAGTARAALLLTNGGTRPQRVLALRGPAGFGLALSRAAGLVDLPLPVLPPLDAPSPLSDVDRAAGRVAVTLVVAVNRCSAVDPAELAWDPQVLLLVDRGRGTTSQWLRLDVAPEVLSRLASQTCGP